MRLRPLIRLFVTLLLIFVTQKILFMFFNMGAADGVPFLACVSVLWHGLRLDIASACYLTAIPLVVTIVSLFFRRFPLRKVLSPYFLIVSIVLALIFVADTLLYRYWGAKVDANDLFYAAKPKDMLASLPLWGVILAFAVVAVFSFLYYWALRRTAPPRIEDPRPRSRRLLPGLLYLPLGALLFLGMRGSVEESTANPSYAYFSSHAFCNHAALNPAFNIFHSLFKSQDLRSEWDTLSEAEVDGLLGNSFDPDPTLADTLLRIERPNVLLIVWEGAGMGMVGSDSVAPNLWRLIPEGVYFSNCYANSFRTDRGLVSLLSGWLGLPTLSLMKRTDLCRHLPSIAASLRDVGYATSFAYGGDIDFTNMRLYFSETGFSRVTGEEAFPTGLRTSAWGVPDEHLLTPALIPADSHFFSAALTLSSHEPWQVSTHRLADAKRNAFAYSDSCLGALVAQLKASPRWDSLLVVIIPDHGIPFEGGQRVHDTAVAHIPILWIGGAIKTPRTIDCLMSQSDLAATLLAQMGLDISRYPFSRNVLGTQYPARRQFATCSSKNQVNLITPDGSTVYDCVSRTGGEETSFIEALLQRLYHTSADLSIPKK